MSNDDLIRRGDLLKPDEKSDKILILGGRVGAGKMLAMAEALMKRKIETVPAVAAVPVEKLGKLGKYMMPYTGDPRGPMGMPGIFDPQKDALMMDTFEDVDGSVWRPVLEPVLQELLRRVSVVPYKVGDRIFEVDGDHGIVTHKINEVCVVYNTTATDDNGNEWLDFYTSEDIDTAYKTWWEAKANLPEPPKEVWT